MTAKRLFLALALAALVFPLTAAAAITLTLPANIVVEAQSPSGTLVTYTVTATDSEGEEVDVTCNPPSGARFPIATTTVSCVAASESESATGSFQVTVRDTVAPVVVQPSNIVVQATSLAGATVNYPAPTVVDAGDANPTVTCSPPPGTFGIGSTTVTCRATDKAGNVSQPVLFTIRVTREDVTAPVFSPAAVPDVVREANAATGSVVNYTPPTASDATDGPVPVTCSPAPGATFAIGATRVTCRVRDARGNEATVDFNVVVRDTTPPTLVAPAPITVTATGDTVPATNPAIAAFLAGATASDLVTAAPAVTHDAPAFLPLGTTEVTFTARDAAGNTATARSSVTVTTGPSGPPPSVPDTTPPGNVSNLVARAGSRVVRLSWRLPSDPDFDHVEILRARAAAPEATVLVYSGTGTTFRDRGVRNGIEYRYLAVSYDEAGNASIGAAVTAQPKAVLLLRPPNGARVTTPPTLVWVHVAGASYYNVQVFRGRKILSAWPSRARLQMRSRWTFAGRTYRLSPGLYRWYVWPGFGRKSDARYGRLLGESTFRVT